MKLLRMIAKAFDAFYNFLYIVMKTGMVACMLALKLIINKTII